MKKKLSDFIVKKAFWVLIIICLLLVLDFAIRRAPDNKVLCNGLFTVEPRYVDFDITDYGYAALRSDGTIDTYNLDEEFGPDIVKQIEAWENIVDIECTQYNVFALKKDGTVVSTHADMGSDLWADWKNIVDIETAPHQTVGLRKDGTVMLLEEHYTHEYGSRPDSWENVVSLSTSGCSNGDYVFALHKDGSMSCSYEPYPTGPYETMFTSGKKVSSIASSGWLHLAVAEDGTVSGGGEDYVEEIYNDVKEWTNIDRAFPGTYFALGLKKDGTVVSASINQPNPVISEWENVTQLYVSNYTNYVIAILDNNTVCVANGAGTSRMSFDASGWHDIVKLERIGVLDESCYYAVGLRDDGELLMLQLPVLAD